MAISVNGTLIQNTSRQSWNSQTMKMPYSGPSTMPSSCAAPMPPSTPARLRCAQRSAPRASVTGSSAPLATPWMVRPTISTWKAVLGSSPSRPHWPICTDNAVTTEPTMNRARLSCSTSLRPNRSDARPSNGIAAM